MNEKVYGNGIDVIKTTSRSLRNYVFSWEVDYKNIESERKKILCK